MERAKTICLTCAGASITGQEEFNYKANNMRREKPVVTPSEIREAMSGQQKNFSEYYSDTNQTIIRDITINESIVIDEGLYQTAISFVDCNFYESIHIYGGTFNGFSISGGRMTKPLIIYGGTFNVHFRLQEVNAQMMKNEVYVSVGFWGGEFNCNISIYKGAFQEISIANIGLKCVLIGTGSHSSYNHDLEPYIKRLMVSPKQIDVLDVSNFKLGHLGLSGVLERGLYSFANLELHQLELRYFINLGRVRLDTITVASNRGLPTGESIKPSLFLVHSHLGQTRFSQMDFSKFAKVEVTDCALTDIENANIKWFSSNQLDNLGDEAKRDLFRQLKHAMIKQGNLIDERHFRALEMEAYRRTISLKTDFWDLVILFWEKYTNNFGTSYILPILWLIAVSFAVLSYSLWEVNLSIRDNWGSVFVVMNPTHSIDYLVPKDKVSNTFMAVDFAGRVLIALLIYQIITAFRKFAREGSPGGQ